MSKRGGDFHKKLSQSYPGPSSSSSGQFSLFLRQMPLRRFFPFFCRENRRKNSFRRGNFDKIFRVVADLDLKLMKYFWNFSSGKVARYISSLFFHAGWLEFSLLFASPFINFPTFVGSKIYPSRVLFHLNSQVDSGTTWKNQVFFKTYSPLLP